ncbi:hypothetical protein EDB82DRAFT_506194 [Fusarium venenatum]|uniref:uncharacterized protein n=1 Tax=Fusarium venenatum TaxID=56646 RepID=UPI001D57114A|nr:hypothetical protein EDB82DRAFT_506194 [Fusarium venenatum]
MGVERQIVVLFGTVFHLSAAVLSIGQPSWAWKYALRSCSGQGEGHVSLRLNSGESKTWDPLRMFCVYMCIRRVVASLFV